jgi:hypothetical protein
MIIDDGMMWHLMRGAWLCLQPVRACVSLEPGLVPRDPVLRCHPHSMQQWISDIYFCFFKLSERVTPGRRLPYARAPAKRAFVPGRVA